MSVDLSSPNSVYPHFNARSLPFLSSPSPTPACTTFEDAPIHLHSPSSQNHTSPIGTTQDWRTGSSEEGSDSDSALDIHANPHCFNQQQLLTLRATLDSSESLPSADLLQDLATRLGASPRRIRSWVRKRNAMWVMTFKHISK